jgi:membrane protein DedA with SNARE-associated domain
MERMENLAEPLLEFIKAHQSWSIAIMSVTAFGESFAFLSLLFPGTAILIAAGTLMKSGTLPFLPVMVGAILGAVLGDSVSYWIGRRFGGGIARLWPFSRNPELLPTGIQFFERYGDISVFIGRFFGPVRAVIPLAAGIMRMPRWRFWLANITSALVWAPLLLFFGEGIGRAGEQLVGSANRTIVVSIVFGGLILFGIAGVIWAVVKTARSKT